MKSAVSPTNSVTIGTYTGYYIRNGGTAIVHIGHGDGTYASGSSNTFIGYESGRGGTTLLLLVQVQIMLLLEEMLTFHIRVLMLQSVYMHLMH